MDVSRALLLPSEMPPSDDLLLNLALYWDQVVVVRDRHDVIRSPLGIELRDNVGFLTELVRDIDVMAPLEADTNGQPRPRADERGYVPLQRDPSGRLVFVDILWVDPDLLVPSGRPDRQLHDLTYALGRLRADHFVARVQDALDIATEGNLAPLAPSLESHVATMVDAFEPGAPTREAAMLSAIIEMFEIDPSTPLDDVLQFREKHGTSMARFRASLGDLAAGLRSESSANASLIQARDVVRNRVEPALSELEDVLKQSRLKFAWKSVVGATAISLAPVTPTIAARGGTQLVAQTLDYSMSRSDLLRSHPYGYIHQVQKAFRVEGQPAPVSLARRISDAREVLREFYATLTEHHYESRPTDRP